MHASCYMPDLTTHATCVCTSMLINPACIQRYPQGSSDSCLLHVQQQLTWPGHGAIQGKMLFPSGLKSQGTCPSAKLADVVS